MITSGIPCRLNGIFNFSVTVLESVRSSLSTSKKEEEELTVIRYSGADQTRTDLHQPFAKALMGFHGALAVLEAVLACTNYRYHTC